MSYLSPLGPAGTGKTESVKALGHQMGRFVLVFNCDETFDFQACVLCACCVCICEFVHVHACAYVCVRAHVYDYSIIPGLLAYLLVYM